MLLLGTERESMEGERVVVAVVVGIVWRCLGARIHVGGCIHATLA